MTINKLIIAKKLNTASNEKTVDILKCSIKKIIKILKQIVLYEYNTLLDRCNWSTMTLQIQIFAFSNTFYVKITNAGASKKIQRGAKKCAI